MCTRYTLVRRREELVLADLPLFRYAIDHCLDWEPRYHVPPTAIAPVMRYRDEELELVALRWGLIPRWAREIWKGTTFNARAEEIVEKASYKASLRDRRCLVPADGWIEWRHEGKERIPQYFQLPEQVPFFFAGLWDRAPQYPGGPVESFTVVTTEPTATMAQYHDRQPLLLRGEACAQWLAPEASLTDLRALMQPYDGAITVRILGKAINSSKAPNQPELLEPPAPPSLGPLFQ